jgi:hypothetical protein
MINKISGALIAVFLTAAIAGSAAAEEAALKNPYVEPAGSVCRILHSI